MAGQDAVLNVGANLVQGTKQAFTAIAKGFAAVSKGMSTQAKAMKAMGDAAGAVKFDKFANSMDKATGEIKEQITVLDKLGDGYEEAAVAGDKLVKANEKITKSKAKAAQEATTKATATKGTTGGEAAENEAIQRRIDLINHLDASYHKLITSTNVYGADAKRVMQQLRDDEIDPVKAGQKILYLQKQSVAINKVSDDLKKLTALYPKEAAAIAKANTSYDTQLAILKKVEAGKKSLAITANKRILEEAKEAAALGKLTEAASLLQLRYKELIGSGTRFANSTKTIIAEVKAGNITFAKGSALIAAQSKQWKAMTAVQKQSEAAYAKMAARLKELAALYPKNAAALAKSNRTYKQQITSLERLDKARNALRAGAIKEAELLQRLTNKVPALISRYDKLANSTTKYGKRAKQIQAIVAKDPMYYDRASAALQKLEMRQKRLLQGMTPLQQATQRLGRSFKTYLSYMAASSAIFAVLQVFREATTTVVEYDQALKDLQAITQSTDADVAAMGETIKQVASDTKFSAVETAEGMKLLGQSGLSAQESIDTIGAVANLATGTLTDMDTTVDLLTTSMRVFGIEAEDSARISDVWANAVNRSKLTIDKIRTAMNYIGPVAAAVGVDLENVAGAMMIMANQGIRASTIGTGLRQVFRRLVDPSKDMKVAMAEAGLTMADLDPKTVGLKKVFENLKLVVKDSEDAFKMFGQRGATAVLAVTKESASLQDMLDIVGRSGTAADMAATQMEGLGVSFKNLQDKIKNLYIALGESGLAGGLRIVVDLARGLVDVFTGVFSNKLVQVTTQIIALTTAAAVLGRTILWISKIIKAQFATSIVTAATSMGGYTASTTAAAGATTLFGKSVSALKLTLVSTGIGAFIIALGAIAGYAAGARDRIADFGRELKAQNLKTDTNIDSLQEMRKRLEETGGSEAYLAKITEKLADKYEDYSEQIKDASASSDDLIGVLDDLIEAEERLKGETSLKQFRNDIQGMNEAALALKANTGIDASIREFFGMNPRKKAKEARELGEGYLQNIVKGFAAAKEKTPTLTLMDHFKQSGVNAYDIKHLDFDKLKSQIEKGLEELASKSEDTGQVIADNMSKGMSEAEAINMLNAEQRSKEASARKEDYQSELKEFDAAAAEKLLMVERAEADSLMSAERAEKEMTRLKIANQDERLRIATTYYEKMKVLGVADATADAYQAQQNELKKSYNVRLQELKKFGKEREKLEKEIANKEKTINKETKNYDKELTKDRAKEEKLRNDHTKAVADKRKDIEKQVADKIKQINEDLYKKLDDLRKERVDRENQAARDIKSIGQSGDDKILSIRQRGMTDEQKEKSNAQAASKRYYDAEAAMAKAKKTRDLEDLAVAQQLYESSSGYYESLEDAGQAESGVRKITNALQEARKLQLELEKEEIGKKETAAKDEAAEKRETARRDAATELTEFKSSEAEKLSVALKTIQDAAALRKTEHEETMRQHREELAVIKEKLAVTKQRQSDVSASIDALPEGAGPEASVGDGVPSLADYGLDEMGNKIEEKVADGVEGGVNKGITRSPWREAGTQIEEPVQQGTKQGVEDGLFDGVKVDGVPLEEWKARGVKAGEQLLEGVGYAIETNSEGIPVAVTIKSDADQKASDIVTEVQNKLDQYPGEMQLETDVAQAELERFITAASNRTIKIKVQAIQAESEGGPVYAMAGGGRLPGYDSPKDKLNVLARPGEWFIKNESVKAWTSSVGDWFMRGVNAPGSAAGQRLQSLLDVNSTLSAQNRSISKLASNAGKQDSGMGEFGTINFQLASDEPAIPAMMRPVDAAELMRQLGKQGRLAA